MKKFLTALAIVLLACSCNKDEGLADILKDGTVRLCISGVSQFTYNPLTCQLGFCREKCEFRAFTDNMSDFFTLSLDRIPSSTGEFAVADITWTSPSSIGHKEKIALETVKIEGDKIWLWDSGSKISAVVRVLE